MSGKEKVFLLHGIALNRYSLIYLQNRLQKSGFDATALSYPSTTLPLDALADWFYTTYLEPTDLNSYGKIHFIGHSMGGLVIRETLAKYKDRIDPDKVGRVVMLGSPNQGSELADAFKDFRLYKWFFGPAGQELTTHHRKTRLYPCYYEVGILAGTVKWLYPLSCIWIKGDHDGRVSVDSTKLPDMKDHISLKTSHTFMIYRRDVSRQIISFIKTGSFERG
ncbi:MAG: alpha/beta fold hydrolase [Pseudobdellovibrionaceae bacterium]|jgi:pimeloyl-ACP methyl ester carboxylesterase|nr:alpha/beta fold hydrolase [Pseudobdellovibrionaceae bacterium]